MRSIASIAAWCLALAAASAHAWPTGPLRIIVPFGPGSTPDITARLVADKLAPRLGQPVVVENKPGAGGNVGTDMVAKAQPDGRTIGLSIAGPLAVNALLYKKALPYDPAKDLEPVTIAATQPSVLVAAAKHPVKDVAALLGMLRAQPGKFAYSSMGAGSISHLAMEALAAKSGASLVHVPYAGSGPAVRAVLAGEVDLACLPAAAVDAHVKAGRLHALAVTTAKRARAMPEVPTLAESGIEGVYAEAWMGFVLPARTPAGIVKRWRDEITAVLGDPAVRDRFRQQHMEVVANTPEEFRDVLDGDRSRWKAVIEANDIRLD